MIILIERGTLFKTLLQCINFTVSGFKNLLSLEICGGGLTDAGVKNIKDLTSLTLLNLSQNCNLTDKTLELVSGTFSLLLEMETLVFRIFYFN